MTPASPSPPTGSAIDEFEFLCVARFLDTEIDARAIDSALRLGLLDVLLADGPTALPMLAARHRLNPTGLRLLLDILETNGVVARRGDRIALTTEF
ncbi:MAG TPA: hypothetical protein VNF04_18705, partial [Stellaceae bacterium]|nr:hypothetical protein [Stellaceae bacterium]